MPGLTSSTVSRHFAVAVVCRTAVSLLAGAYMQSLIYFILFLYFSSLLPHRSLLGGGLPLRLVDALALPSPRMAALP